jgi:4-amino-4-deoxy-L-arabinose transferase-like glycosyltransferase
MAAGQIVFWTLAPALTHSAPPLDVVESYMWGREWLIATYKHPALPGWVLEASRLLTGAVGWPAYLASQLFVAATFAIVFLLGRDMMGPERAAAGTLLLAGVAYYAWPTPEFNHNIAEMPFWAGLTFALWRAVERQTASWWLLTGACAAGGLYAKLSTALLLVTAAGWIGLDARARRSLATPGPWLGVVVFAACVAPLALWLIEHDFAPLRYAAQRAGQRPMAAIPLFLFNTLLNLTGLLVMLVAAGLITPPPSRATAPTTPPIDERARRYLVALTVGPLTLALLGALLAQTGLKTAWGSSMFNLIGLLAVAFTSRRFRLLALRRIAGLVALILLLVPTGYAAVVILAPRLLGAPLRVHWPQAEIAERFSGIWARAVGRPLQVVTGDDWVAGLVGLTAKDLPSIMNNGDPALSPWIAPNRLKSAGMLIVWDARRGGAPLRLQPLMSDASHVGEERFTWSRQPGLSELVIRYAIVPPRPVE